MAEIYGAVLPIPCFLLPNKTQQTYTALIDMKKELELIYEQPEHYLILELPYLPHFKKNFAASMYVGCFFHLAQKVQKHLALQGLNTYNNEPNFALSRDDSKPGGCFTSQFGRDR